MFSLADVQALATQSGPNTVINFGGGNTLTLNNVTRGNLVAGDFVFANTITGDGNDNTLIGTAGNDAIDGLGGDDDLQGLAGNDLLNGGSGNDRAVYTDATGAITVSLAAGIVTGADVGTDTLRSIELVRGSNFADSYNAVGFNGSSANAGSQVFNAGTLNEFEGGGGNDVITGNGDTQLSYVNATGSVTVDLATGTGTGDASVGTDTFTGVNGILGSNFADTLLGSNTLDPASEVFEGRGGNDFIDGRGGFDRVLYNTDPAVTSGISVDMAAGIVIGDAATGTDTLRGIELVRGTDFVDTYVATGFSGASTNAGYSGTLNEFEGLAGNDQITGNGDTRVSYLNATAGVTVDIAAGTGTGDASVGTDSFTGVARVRGSHFNDTLSGSNNVSGTQQLEGRGGDDFLDGRGGFDLARYDNDIIVGANGVSVDLAAGIVTGVDATATAAIGIDTLRSIEAVKGTLVADTYTATGFSGSSTNAGSNGTFNQFEGMSGNDTVIGNGNTEIVFFSAAAAVTVDFGAGTAIGDASIGTDTFSSVNSVQGSNFGDLLIGASGNQRFAGRTGADTFVIADNNGADIVNDFNHGQGDKIDLTGVTGVFSLADVQALATQSGPNTVINFGGGNTLTLNNVTRGNLVAGDFVFANTITGDGNDNTLIGTAGNDAIDGLGGDDDLQGLAGNDLLNGGSGNDRAVYTDATGAITVSLAAGIVTGADVGTDTLRSIELVRGSNFADSYNAVGFNGSSANAGSQVFNAGTLNEFEGGGGNDVITGNGDTQLSYVNATGSVTVDLATGTGTGDASVGTDTFTGVNGILGSNFADTLLGSNTLDPASEVFEGRGGNDFIDGRGGFDRVLYNTDPAVTSGISVDMAAGIVIGDAATGTDTLRGIELVAEPTSSTPMWRRASVAPAPMRAILGHSTSLKDWLATIRSPAMVTRGSRT